MGYYGRLLICKQTMRKRARILGNDAHVPTLVFSSPPGTRLVSSMLPLRLYTREAVWSSIIRYCLVLLMMVSYCFGQATTGKIISGL